MELEFPGSDAQPLGVDPHRAIGERDADDLHAAVAHEEPRRPPRRRLVACEVESLAEAAVAGAERVGDGYVAAGLRAAGQRHWSCRRHCYEQQVERWRDDLFCFRERLEESSSILRMLLQNPVLGMRETPRLKTRFLLPCWIIKPAVPYGTGKLTVRHVSPAYQRRIFFWRNYFEGDVMTMAIQQNACSI